MKADRSRKLQMSLVDCRTLVSKATMRIQVKTVIRFPSVGNNASDAQVSQSSCSGLYS